MREKIRTQFPVEGAGKLELFERGKLVERLPFTNFVAPEGLIHNRWQVRQDFHENLPGVNNADPETTYPFSNVLLTDSAQAEDTGETWPLGVPIGWSDKTLYSGADVMRGSPNADECAADLDSVTWVFDWPTHAAVGTIQSVIWCPAFAGTNSVWTSLRAVTVYSFNGTSFGASDADSGLGSIAVDPSGDLWVVGYAIGSFSGTLRVNKLSLVDGSIVITGPSFSALGYSQASGRPVRLAVDDTHMFTTQDGVIHKFTKPVDSATPTKTTIPTPGGETAISDLAVDNTHLWVSGGSGTLYRIDKTTGAIERQFNVVMYPGETGGSVAYNPVDGLLYVGGYTGSQAVSLNRATIRRYALDGTPIGASGISAMSSVSALLAIDSAGMLYAAGNGAWSNTLRRVNTLVDGVMGTRARLSAPVIKSSVQTMKLTYTFTFV